MKRASLILLAGCFGAASLCLFVQPINSSKLKLLLLLCAAGFYAVLLALSWRSKALRLSLIGALGFCVILVSLPGRTPDVAALREKYVASLQRYSGVTYIWGGEGKMGIDCSGLPRRALQDALLNQGILTFNGLLIREAIRQWWFDASAKALAEGYQGYMTPLFPAKALRSADFSSLEPGDVVITASGVHCLVFLKSDSWMQADPAVGKVANFNARSTDNSWFDDPVKIHRWVILDEKAREKLPPTLLE